MQKATDTTELGPYAKVEGQWIRAISLSVFTAAQRERRHRRTVRKWRKTLPVAWTEEQFLVSVFAGQIGKEVVNNKPPGARALNSAREK